MQDPTAILSLVRATPPRCCSPPGTVCGWNACAQGRRGQPHGSFKVRGLAAAVSKARELVRKLAVPTAGNAGGALAA